MVVSSWVGHHVDSVPPRTDLHLSNSSINEGIDIYSVIAILSSKDPDLKDTFEYSLIAGDGDADNSAFSINGEKLIINKFPDFETQSAYSIRVQTKDSGGLTYEKAFLLTVDDLGQPTSPVLFRHRHRRTETILFGQLKTSQHQMRFQILP